MYIVFKKWSSKFVSISVANKWIIYNEQTFKKPCKKDDRENVYEK